MESGGRPPPRLAAFSRSRSVGQVAGADGAEERAEAAPGRVGPGDQVALEDVGEEVLGQVPRLLGRVAAVPDVGVDGIPVRLAEARQRLPGLRRVAAGGRDHAAPLRRGEPARDVAFGLKLRHNLPRRGPNRSDGRCERIELHYGLGMRP